jgi:hypothetical protein
VAAARLSQNTDPAAPAVIDFALEKFEIAQELELFDEAGAVTITRRNFRIQISNSHAAAFSRRNASEVCYFPRATCARRWSGGRRQGAVT